jgi:predicted CopG family antitoxin
MPQAITISDDLYRLLLQHAESFEDSPEDVIRRLLMKPDASATPPSGTTSARMTEGERAAPGSILPEREYWRPILEVLMERGGSAHANDVIEEVGRRLEGRLMPKDLEDLKIGEVRWRNRVRFARLRMKEQGLLSDSSARGIWEMTAKGHAYLTGDRS